MYAINLRIPVGHYMPDELRNRGKLFINIGAISSIPYEKGQRVYLSENFKEAEVIGYCQTSRSPESFDFNLG